jgi:hypothetical protein
MIHKGVTIERCGVDGNIFDVRLPDGYARTIYLSVKLVALLDGEGRTTILDFLADETTRKRDHQPQRRAGLQSLANQPDGTSGATEEAPMRTD